jgi:protein STE50
MIKALTILLEEYITGDALVALVHPDLKDMGISSIGHRLTILKGVYDIKVKQNVTIEPDHYVPLCKCPFV